MTDALLGHAAAFLDLLTQDPAPAALCAELVENCSMPTGVVAAALRRSEPPLLREIARQGSFPQVPAGTVQIDSDAARCLREGRILLVDASGHHAPTTRPLVAHVPIRAAGRSVGVLSLGFAENEPWSISEYRSAEGFADSIGLWLARAAVAAGPRPAPTLTSRQQQVLQLLAETRSTSEIAQILDVSRTTTKTDIRAVLAALGVSDRISAVRAATEHGLIGGRTR